MAVFLRLGRGVGNAVKAAYLDYKAVFTDMGRNAWAHPGWAAAKLAAFGAVAYTGYTKPAEVEYRGLLREYSQALLMLGRTERNPRCLSYLQTLREQEAQGRLEFWDLGLVLLVMRADHGAAVKSFLAQHHPLPAQLRALRTHLVDVGLWGHFRNLETQMENYDIHED
eukprot:m.54568 g.54568  ORF g.54568 m.54568 type:complete len:168 (+) comp15528_c0_seq1:29-532(+)